MFGKMSFLKNPFDYGDFQAILLKQNGMKIVHFQTLW